MSHPWHQIPGGLGGGFPRPQKLALGYLVCVVLEGGAGPQGIQDGGSLGGFLAPPCLAAAGTTPCGGAGGVVNFRWYLGQLAGYLVSACAQGCPPLQKEGTLPPCGYAMGAGQALGHSWGGQKGPKTWFFAQNSPKSPIWVFGGVACSLLLQHHTTLRTLRFGAPLVAHTPTTPHGAL